MARIKSYHIRDFDWISFALTLILVGIGLVAVYSATYRVEQPYSPFFYKQLFGCISGLFIYFIFVLTDYRSLLRWGYWAYFVIIGLLIFTLAKGHIGMGGQRWIKSDQPAANLREIAARAGGHATLFRAAFGQGNPADGVFHPLSSGVSTIVRRLKQEFDPQGLFNPSRLVWGV